MRKARAVGCDEHNFIVQTRLRECGLRIAVPAHLSLNTFGGNHRMNRSIIASFVALSLVAGPAVAATTAKPTTTQTKAQKHAARVAAKQQKAAAKTK
jgi:hypothetical protein